MLQSEFAKALQLAASVRTLYVMGGWGYPLGYGDNRDRTQKAEYNRSTDRREKIYNAPGNTFAFDCCGLIKGCLNGWRADLNDRNGGAVYGTPCPDWDAKELMFNGCSDPTTDFSKIDPYEMLWLDGHCGVYIGDGLAIESTARWADCVQITAVSNLGEKAGYHSRKWTYHGHLKFVEYDTGKYPQVPFTAENVLKGVAVRSGPFSDCPIIATIKLGSTIKVEALEGASGDFAKITGYVYLPGGFTWEGSEK